MRRVECRLTGREREEFGFTKEDTGSSGKKLQDCGEGVDDAGDGVTGEAGAPGQMLQDLIHDTGIQSAPGTGARMSSS